jgi:hypothetical protein
MKRALYWTLFAITMSIYGTMLIWSLPQIAAAAGGLLPFDLRPGGYAGKAFYHGTQHTLDTIYPPLLSLTLFYAIVALAKPIGRWRWLLALPALPIAVFDLVENVAVDRMLEAGAAGLTPDLAAHASLFTVLKADLSTLTMSILLVVLVARGFGWLRSLRSPRVFG